MEGGDIGVTVHKHVACMFEGLLMTPKFDGEVVLPKKRSWNPFKSTVDDTVAAQAESISRTWISNEMPMKALIHLVNYLDIGVEVYTYLDYEYNEAVEHWLARKGASVSVYHYQNVLDLADDFRFNRDVHTLFTTREDDAALLGVRATVVKPDGTFGF